MGAVERCTTGAPKSLFGSRLFVSVFRRSLSEMRQADGEAEVTSLFSGFADISPGMGGSLGPCLPVRGLALRPTAHSARYLADISAGSSRNAGSPAVGDPGPFVSLRMDGGGPNRLLSDFLCPDLWPPTRLHPGTALPGFGAKKPLGACLV